MSPDIPSPALDNNPPTPPQPIVLMLPLPSNYQNASIDALIFLAVESNPKLPTEEAIVNEMHTPIIISSASIHIFSKMLKNTIKP